MGRAAQNRLTHGLARSVHADPASAAAIDRLAQLLAPADKARADEEVAALSHEVAEAQVDLLRVRRARHDLLVALSELAAGGPEALSGIEFLAARLERTERYERRARSRARLAIRAFDAVQRMRYKHTATLAVRTRNSAANSARLARRSATPAPLRAVAPALTLAAHSRSEPMQAALLDDRGVVRVSGEDARKFLNGLLTADIGKLSVGRAAYTALLTPQGKIIVDFLIVEESDGVFLLDCPRAQATTLLQRLSFYKLRAKVTIEDVSEHLQVFAVWDGKGESAASPDVPAQASPSLPRLRGRVKVGELCFPDPRLSTLGFRLIAPPGAKVDAEPADTAAYTSHRVALGVPEGGIDFAYDDAFPHEADMDQLEGIDFKKGCFVGQEVVSRMEHRGTARTRVVPLEASTALSPGTPVTAGGKLLGAIGSVAGSHALATLRLDRVTEALAEGLRLEAGGAALTLRKPSWARFAFPGEEKT